MCFLNFFLTIIFIFFFSTNSMAFQNEPDGFRGIKWGTQVSIVKGLQHKDSVPSADEITYTKRNDNLEIAEGIRADSIEYIFVKNRFDSVSIILTGPSNWAFLKVWLFKNHGMPNKRNEKNIYGTETLEWRGKNATIRVSHLIIPRDFTSLQMFYGSSGFDY